MEERRRRTRPAQTPAHQILGIDPSLKSTGYAYRRDGTLYTGRIDTAKLTGPHRLVYARNQLSSVLDAAQPTTVVYEDYAMGARGNNMFHIGELGGILKVLCWERGIDILLVSPTALKKMITGKGNADSGKAGKRKPEMRRALREKFGYDLDQDDEADAFGLLIVGELKLQTSNIAPALRHSLRLDGLDACKIVKGRLQSISKRPATTTNRNKVEEIA